VSGLDAPGFRIEIVGAVTDILHRPDGYAVIGDGNHAARGVGREYEGFASKILQGVFVGELSLRKLALRQLSGENFQVADRYVNSMILWLASGLPVFAEGTDKKTFTSGNAWYETIDGGIKALKQ
jgi:hypothetical protein